MKKSLCVIRDLWLNPWDAGNYYGLADCVELAFAYTGQPLRLVEMKALYPKAEFIDYTDDIQRVLDREFDVLDVPDLFYAFSQYFAQRHSKVVHVAWDNLPGGVNNDYSKVWQHIARTDLIAHRLKFEGVENVSVIPAAVDTDMFSPLPLDERENAVLFVGRNVPEKGLTHALWAMNGLDAELWIVSPEISEWQNIWATFGKQVKAIFFGEQSRASLAKVLSETKLLVFPSMPRVADDPQGAWLEQFGQVLIEAMACGTPVVAYDQGSNGEILGAIPTVPCGNWQALRLCITQMLTDLDMWQTMSDYGRSKTINGFSQEFVAKLILDHYEIGDTDNLPG